MSTWPSKLLDRFLFSFLAHTRRSRPLERRTDSVLLVHFAHIGDFVLWLDSARAYREIYPGKKIVLLCRRFKDVSAIAARTGCFDEIVVIDDGWRHRAASVVRMMRESYDVVINARLSRDLQSDVFALAPRSGQRIVPSSDRTLLPARWIERSDAAYTRVVACDGMQTMELIRNAQFVRGLGDGGFRAALPELPASVRPAGLPPAFFAVCPGANNEANRWPADRFAAAVDVLTEVLSIPCVLLGTAGESGIGRSIREKSRAPEKIVSCMGRTDQAGYIEAIRAARFLLTNDTSAAHIAPAVKTRAVVIQPGWNYGRFFPYRTERQGDEAWFPRPVCAPLPCRGCGKDPTTDGDRGCIQDRVMRCVLAVETRWVIEEVFDLLGGMKGTKEVQDVDLDDDQEKSPGDVRRGRI